MNTTASAYGRSPDWGALFGVGSRGWLLTATARKYLGNGRVVRVRRGIHRLVHVPASEHEDLVVLSLWAAQDGAFSHETALALHDLSDVLPSKIHMTIPASWGCRRLRVPADLVLHYAESRLTSPLLYEHWHSVGLAASRRNLTVGRRFMSTILLTGFF